MKKGIKSLIVFFIIFLSFANLVYAQSYELNIKFSRDLGYAAIGSNDIQGLFSIIASSSSDLSKVTFYMDGNILGEVTSEPFKFQFNTDNFPVGNHSFYADGETTSGEKITSVTVNFTFISAEASKNATVKIIAPVLGLVLVITLFSALIPALLRKKKGSVPLGTQRNYGMAGGTICSRCNRPFERHAMSPNMVLGKLEVCPHCGKWGIYRALPLDVLRKAEKDEVAKSSINLQSEKTTDDDNLLRKKLDDSRFEE